MAYCQKCGAQADDAAAFCGVCGASMGAAATPPKVRSGKLVWIAAVVVLVAVLGVGIPVGIGAAGEARKKAQAEAAADFIQGIATGDFDLVLDAVPSEYADAIRDEFDDDGNYDERDVEREWDGDVLVLSIDDDSEAVRIELEADGEKDSAEVDIQIQLDGELEDSGSAVVELEDDRWVVVEWFGENFEDEYSREGSARQACFAYQRQIEGVTSQWLAYDPSRSTWDVQGEVDWDHPFFDTDSPEEPYFNDVPLCPTTDANYYLDENGQTGCPEHGYYAD